WLIFQLTILAAQCTPSDDLSHTTECGASSLHMALGSENELTQQQALRTHINTMSAHTNGHQSEHTRIYAPQHVLAHAITARHP
ncbi:UNVERIFIED_CONTAM: hypothetical protein NY603_34220, partial [Bacteroidetes bacterium 56_B9]